MFSYSAVVTSFNSEKTISRALHSISIQLIKPFDVILIDDNSKDNTVKIAREFQEKLPNFQIIVNSENKGQSAGKNLGARIARGNFLVFFDDDDVSLSIRSKIHALHHENGADISFVSSVKHYSDEYEVNCTNRNLALIPPIRELGNLLLLGKESKLLYELYIPSSTCAVSKLAFNTVGGFDQGLRRLEDVDLAIRFGLNNLKFSWASEVGVLRFHSENTSKGRGVDMDFERELLIKYHEILEPKALRLALLHTKSRKLYFSGKYLNLVFHMIRHPAYSIKSTARLQRVISRLIHDLRKT